MLLDSTKTVNSPFTDKLSFYWQNKFFIFQSVNFY